MTTTVMTPSEYARDRGITEVLHFTTNRGLLGILSTGEVFSRKALEAAGKLEPIRLLNCRDRSKDAAWIDWVNLSISQVNKWMLNRSRSWHQDEDGVWWAVLAFDVAILDHTDVWFTTTNNTYPVVRRGQGVEGLADMFTDPMPWGWYGYRKNRRHRAANQPTCEQAEVLYPKTLSLEALTAIYVAEPEHIDEIAGWVCAFLDAPTVPVTCNPAVFA